MNECYDVIIVGSGFGGAPSACRLAAAGKKVLLLERGRRWQADEYPRDFSDDWLWDPAEPEKQNGWLDLRFFGDMSVAQASGLGGGSLVYASAFIEAQADVFNEGWPEQISHESLKPFYEMTGKMLNVQKMPDNQLSERYHVMADAAKNMGYSDRFEKVDLAINFDPDWSYELDDAFNDRHSKPFINQQGQEQGSCIHCANCDIGCQVKAKNTLDLNYIAQAELDGAQVKTSHLVTHIEPKGSEYLVHFQNIADGKKVAGSYRAKKVILSAGSLGSTEILLRSRDEHKTLPKLSPRLGLGWCANGDFVTPSFHKDREIHPTQGPTISSSINLLNGEFEGQALFIEDGGIPDVVGNYLEEKLKSPFFRYIGIRKYPLFKAFAKNIRNRKRAIG